MPDIVLDTNVLADFLSQFFDAGRADRGHGRFVADGTVTTELSRRLNRILGRHYSYVSVQDSLGPAMQELVVSSAFAFIEIGRKWGDIAADRFSEDQLFAFVNEPPDWFDIAPVDEDLLPSYVDVPSHVLLGGTREPIEWTDAVHVATAISRDPSALLATTDRRLHSVRGVRCLNCREG